MSDRCYVIVHFPAWFEPVVEVYTRRFLGEIETRNGPICAYAEDDAPNAKPGIEEMLIAARAPFDVHNDAGAEYGAGTRRVRFGEDGSTSTDAEIDSLDALPALIDVLTASARTPERIDGLLADLRSRFRGFAEADPITEAAQREPTPAQQAVCRLLIQKLEAIDPHDEPDWRAITEAAKTVFNTATRHEQLAGAVPPRTPDHETPEPGL